MEIDFGSDQRDMDRMGRKVELRRTFNLHSCIGFSMILNSSWPFVLVTGTYSLSNGGLAGNIWLFLVVCVGMFMVMLSMAEMASITPSAGAQYHWTSEYAPHRCHKYLSFAVGWLSTVGWIACMVLVSYVCAQQLQSLIWLYHPGYVAHAWHDSLLTISFNLIAVAFNILLVRKLALIEGLVLILYIAGFFFVIVVLWVMGERTTAEAVFTEFENDSGWASMVLACLVNVSGPVITLIGADSSCHLAEEMRNARWGVPRAMITNASVSYVLGAVMWITFLFNVGNIEAVQNSPYGQSYVAILYYATGSRTATTFCVSLILFLMIMCAVNQTTTASRQVYAFARDNGLPFSTWLCKVRQGWDFPLNALLATLVCSLVISMATIPSANAFNVINAFSLGGLFWSYLIAISVAFWRKITLSERFPVGKFIMGHKLGLVVNSIAIGFLIIVLIFSQFPLVAYADAQTMNWSCLALAIAGMGFVLYYFLYAKEHYTSPVERTRKHE
ncbi:amino acid transporter [Myriangium duriaei CBS 260.36]|uniref:Amino acid transporter n=1 Tax=Myriangium duriaei CBS 260.36 TaxID=1168546 RepID=A0A9P4MQJ9_9PEZI|nr:amino acid transporter [Myriangium duriaei CBS 260.36]